MSMILSGDGTVTGLAVGGLPNATIVQADLASGVAGNGPAFRATTSGNTSVSQNVQTKIQFDTKTFDTNTNFNTSNYRFTPTVAGYYQVNAYIEYISYTATYVQLNIYKNGSIYSNKGAPFYSNSGIVSFVSSDLVYCNGSTDYIEIYSSHGTAGTLNASNGIFSASMVRSA